MAQIWFWILLSTLVVQDLPVFPWLIPCSNQLIVNASPLAVHWSQRWLPFCIKPPSKPPPCYWSVYSFLVISHTRHDKRWFFQKEKRGWKAIGFHKIKATLMVLSTHKANLYESLPAKFGITWPSSCWDNMLVLKGPGSSFYWLTITQYLRK